MSKLWRNTFVYVVVFFCVSLSAGCAPQSKRIGIITPIQHSPYVARALAGPYEYGPIMVGGSKTKEGELDPLPSRLVVKIDASEVLYHYCPTRRDDSSIRGSVPFLDELPDSVRVSGALEIGVTQIGERLVRLKLEKPMPFAVLKRAFLDSPFDLQEPAVLDARNQAVSSIVVKTERGAFGSIGYDFKPQTYAQLKPDSKLHAVFDSLGVQSIRRVFRRAERPDGKGCIGVVQLKSLAKETKLQNPVRAARGYAELTVPENMENWFLLNFRPGTDLQAALARLETAAGIQQVTYDYPVITHQEPQQEPEFQNQWALQSVDLNGIGILDAWSITVDNDPVVVAVIDTGIKADLDEFQGRMWENADEVPNNGIDDDGNGIVDDRHGITVDDFEVLPYPVVAGTHGTHVAGVLSAEATLGNLIAGVAGSADVRLMNISLGHHQACTDVAEALEYACGIPETEIVNLSLGTAPNQLLWEAVQYCLSEEIGVTLVASAGNSRLRVTEDYFTTNATFPAFYPGVIAVGGSQRDRQIWVDDQDNTRGSNYGVGLDLVAPAENIHTVTFSAPDQTQAALKTDFRGTSASAAFVSGVAALILGKHDTVKLERLRHWLRATAEDVQDPIGTIAAGNEPPGTYTEDDIYTGAGLLNAGRAVTDETPDPVVVDILIEKTGVLKHAVIGSPDLGITVEGPFDDMWELHYAEGDWPDSSSNWISLDVPQDVSSGPLTVARSEHPWPWLVDVESGHNYLHTDNLTNRQVYTLRLKATNAHGTYTAYDVFMPLRAMLYRPPQGTPVPVGWGWPELGGIVDTRPGAMYDIELIDTVTGADVGPARPPRATDYSEPNRGAKWTFLLAPEPYESARDEYIPVHMGMRGDILNHELRWQLNVQSPDGTDTTDTQDIFVDGTSFPAQPGNWPRNIPRAADDSPHGDLNYYFRGVQAADMTGTGDHRIFVYKGGYFMCLAPDGSLFWQKEMFPRPSTIADQLMAPRFVVADLNGDDLKEIVIAGVTRGPGGSWFRESIQVLDKDGNDIFPWPWQIDYAASFVSCPSTEILGSVRVGDIDGLPNGHKEIVFYQLHEGAGNVSIHVLDLNGQELPNYPITLNQRAAYLYVGDIDGDAKDEIIVKPGNLAFDETGAISTWPPQGMPASGGITIAQADTDGPLEVLTYGLTSAGRYFAAVVEGNGTIAQGWPIYLDEAVARFNAHCQCIFFSSIFGTITDSITGDGTRKVVLIYDKIEVFNLNGTRDSAFPVIELGGEARGFDLIDVNGDGTPEYVVLVLVYVDDQGWKDAGYYNLEAFELDGTPLSASDPRWPVRVPSGDSQAWRNTVTIENIDNDPQLELIRVMNMHPYGQCSLLLYGSYGDRAGRIEVLELRD